MTFFMFGMLGMIGALIDAPWFYWAAVSIVAFGNALWRALKNE